MNDDVDDSSVYSVFAFVPLPSNQTRIGTRLSKVLILMRKNPH